MKNALLWDAPNTFQRFIEHWGGCCELVTPQLCATPFFRGSFSLLVVPTGFANPAYSRTLVALRASADRVERFLERGGTLLVFGAAIDREDAYDWLPFRLPSRFRGGPRRVEPVEPVLFDALFGDYDAAALECDGGFIEADAAVIATAAGEPVVVSRGVGDGLVLATTVHEYPSRRLFEFLEASALEAPF